MPDVLTPGELAHPDWAYRDANGRPLRGPCASIDCRYASAPGGADHVGAHSWQDGTTGWPHDYGYPCSCPDCDRAELMGGDYGYIGEFR